MNSNVVSLEKKIKRPAPPKTKGKVPAKKRTNASKFTSEARNLIKVLENRFHDVVFRIETAADEASLQADLGLAELEKQWDIVIDAVSKKIRPLRGVPTKIRAQVDRTKIKAHLAKMDAGDALKTVVTSLGRMESEIQNLQSKVGDDTRVILQRLQRSYKKLIETLGW